MKSAAVVACMMVALSAFHTLAVKVESEASSAANPIRRVVTMLQMMQKKVEQEGEKEKELMEKFLCYCKNGKETLKKSIADAEEKIPQLESEIKAKGGENAQLAEDIEQHKADREAAKAAMAKATEIREKEAAAFAKESAEDKSNLEAMTKAIAAIEKGMNKEAMAADRADFRSGGFLQTSTASVLRRLALSVTMSNSDREMLADFLQQGDGTGYAPASGEIVGILKQMKDTMGKDLAEATATEEAAVKAYDELMAAKQKEVDSLTKAIEDKMKRMGELGIEIVNLKEDLDDTTEALAEDKKFLADLEKNCEAKEKEWEERQKTRSEELLALADTIKILNDDDALELFKKTLPSPSLLQLQFSSKQVRDEALKALKSVRSAGGRRDSMLNLITLALRSKKIDFSKVIKMIDDMVELLGNEQGDDDAKKAYCEKEFDESDDKKKALERSISNLEKTLAEDKEMIGTLTSEIEALAAGIHELDKDVAEATEQRKEEHAEYVQELAANSAALQIIEIAKNRMNKFYNPKLYKPPPKRELTEEERITLNMGGTLAPTNPPGGIAGTGVGLVQSQAAPAPPPETFGAYSKKSEESGGVIQMMDNLKAEVAKEIQELEFNEKDGTEEYEQFVKDSADKRAADSKSIAEKEAAKAGLEADTVKNKDQKAAEEADLMATNEYIADLHADCDWLIANFETRKEARANEIDALKKAKAVLSGADYSLLQVAHRATVHMH